MKLILKPFNTSKFMEITYESCAEQAAVMGRLDTLDANNQQPYSTDGSEHCWPTPG